MDGALLSKTKSRPKTSYSDEIQSINPLRFRHFLLHLNIGPFFLAYLVWLIIWTQHFGVSDYPELGMVVTIVIGILQVVVCLFCYWFVEFRVLMQCIKVKDALKAEVVQVNSNFIFQFQTQ
jgi:hypothetical protein